MLKKLIGLTIAVLLLFSLAACNEVALAQYKTDAKAELDAHVATKVEADYSGDNWAKILGFAATGKAAIDAAENKAGVDSAVLTAKTAINGVPREVGMSISFEEGVFGGKFVGLNGDEEFSAIIRSQQELTDFFDGHDINWQFMTPIWERYDSDFFENNALALFFLWVSGSNIERFVDEVFVDNATLKLQIIWRYDSDAVNDDELFFPIVIEVSKNDTTSATGIEISIRHENLSAN